MYRTYFISFCFFIFVLTPSGVPQPGQSNVKIAVIANQANSSSELTTLPGISSTPAGDSENATNVTEEVPVVVTNNNTSNFAESIIATFSDPYYYASVLAIFSIITVATVSCNRRNGSEVHTSRSYDSPGLFTESKESYYIGRPVSGQYYGTELSSEKKPQIASSNISSILSNNSERVQRPSFKRTQSNESIVSISSSSGIELSKVKDGKKQSKMQGNTAKRDKTTTKHV